MLVLVVILILVLYFLFFTLPLLMVGIGYWSHRRSWRWALAALSSMIVISYLLISEVGSNTCTERSITIVWCSVFAYSLLFLIVAKRQAKRRIFGKQSATISHNQRALEKQHDLIESSE